MGNRWVIVARFKAGSHVQTLLRQDLARCIVGLAENGITDPNELRREAVRGYSFLSEGVRSSGTPA